MDNTYDKLIDRVFFGFPTTDRLNEYWEINGRSLAFKMMDNPCLVKLSNTEIRENFFVTIFLQGLRLLPQYVQSVNVNILSYYV